MFHTLHWDLQRNAAFYATFDGGGRVFFTGVSDPQVARGPERLRRRTLGAVPLAVPIPEEPVPRAERNDAVLVLSRICEAKGTDVALRACRAVGVPPVLAGPVGGQPDRASLDAALADPASPVAGYPDVRWFREHVAPLLDGDRARWIGSVAGAEKEELLRRSRAVLFPIRWPEPGGTAVCETLAAGTPVAARPLGCLPSLVDDGVTGFLAEDEESFGAALHRLDEMTRWRAEPLSPAAFAPSVMADGYEALYAEVLQRAGVLQAV